CFEFRHWKSRLPEHLSRELENFGKVLVNSFNRGGDAGGASANRQSGLQPVQLVLNVLARMLCCPAQQHLRREPADRRLSHETLLVAELQPYYCRNNVATRFLGDQRKL